MEVVLSVGEAETDGAGPTRIGIVQATVAFNDYRFGERSETKFDEAFEAASEKLRQRALQLGAQRVENVRIETAQRADTHLFLTLYGEAVRGA